MKVLFLHGGNGQSQKDLTEEGFAVYLKQQTELSVLVPKMMTSRPETCRQIVMQALSDFQPQMCVGFSFGAALLHELLTQGIWRGPSVLLAPALIRGLDSPTYPSSHGVCVLLVHGLNDRTADIGFSRSIVSENMKPTTQHLVSLVEIEDTHSLTTLTEGEETLGKFIAQCQTDLERLEGYDHETRIQVPQQETAVQQAANPKKKGCFVS
eukprot:Lithocolla_globosa_v1_NODE_9146_length_739_cov_4.890351.p1 type:complete len:210 gc:universal NODE_9146_length_739_cov_4.890351:703-74(-)